MIIILHYFSNFVTAKINQGNVWQSELKYTNTVRYPGFLRQKTKAFIAERELN